MHNLCFKLTFCVYKLVITLDLGLQVKKNTLYPYYGRSRGESPIYIFFLLLCDLSLWSSFYICCPLFCVQENNWTHYNGHGVHLYPWWEAATKRQGPAAGIINHPIKEKLHKIEIRLVWLEEKKTSFFNMNYHKMIHNYFFFISFLL